MLNSENCLCHDNKLLLHLRLKDESLEKEYISYPPLIHGLKLVQACGNITNINSKENKGNAKRGVSPRLTIRPGDLDL